MGVINFVLGVSVVGVDYWTLADVLVATMALQIGPFPVSPGLLGSQMWALQRPHLSTE